MLLEVLSTTAASLKPLKTTAEGPTLRVARWRVAWIVRLLGRVNEALAEQRLLVRDNAAAGTPTPTFTTLAELYRSIGEEQAAAQHRDEAAWLRD